MYRAKDVPYEEGDCVTATYVDLGGGQIEVNNVDWLIDEQKWTRDPFPIGEAYCSSWTSGWCQVRFFILAPWGNY